MDMTKADWAQQARAVRLFKKNIVKTGPGVQAEVYYKVKREDVTGKVISITLIGPSLTSDGLTNVLTVTPSAFEDDMIANVFDHAEGRVFISQIKYKNERWQAPGREMQPAPQKDRNPGVAARSDKSEQMAGGGPLEGGALVPAGQLPSPKTPFLNPGPSTKDGPYIP